jgi:putative ABC transport system ATP-binding protein/lipoprotein-releasing system ATP-binding protein
MAEVLTVENLRFRYTQGSDDLFEGLTWGFPRGRVTAVTGPSGQGKSTLLYILGLLLRPSSGTVRIDGHAVSDLDDEQRSSLRATHFGFVFQDATLDPGRTIIDAVVEPALYAGRTYRQVLPRAHELLDSLGLRLLATHRPGQISGGQAQRVALCRALVNDPAVILADEPTGNLDRENTESVLDILRRAATTGRAVIIATHDPFVLTHADRVLAL